MKERQTKGWQTNRSNRKSTENEFSLPTPSHPHLDLFSPRNSYQKKRRICLYLYAKYFQISDRNLRVPISTPQNDGGILWNKRNCFHNSLGFIFNGFLISPSNSKMYECCYHHQKKT